MFDIVWFIREKILRKEKFISQHPWEELSEKQTTKLGYLLLYCMFFAILVSWYWTLSIIKHIPTKPTYVPTCISYMLESLQDPSIHHSILSNRYNDCDLQSTHPEFNFEEEYSQLQVPYEEIDAIQTKINNLQPRFYSLRSDLQEAEDNYEFSLNEQTAQENSGLYNTVENQNKIREIRRQISDVTKNVETLQAQRKEVQQKYSWEVSLLKEKVENVKWAYYRSYFWYKFYIAILSLIFSVTVFTILYKIYVKQKIKNSPHTIIFSVATFAYWLIVLQVALLFIWDLIPDSFIELLSYIFSAFTPIVFLVQFLWPVLIIAFFWFFIYRIQKRLYSPQNILKRFIVDKKCPNCGNGVDFTKSFCPLCSHEIQIKCHKCNHLTVKWMPFCSSCGTKISQEETK